MSLFISEEQHDAFTVQREPIIVGLRKNRETSLHFAGCLPSLNYG